MNKTLLYSLAAAGAFFAAAAEAGVKNGGFYGPTADSASVTVEQAKQMKDETFVVLRGKIRERKCSKSNCFGSYPEADNVTHTAGRAHGYRNRRRGLERRYRRTGRHRRNPRRSRYPLAQTD